MTAIPRANPSRLSISDDSFSRFFWVSLAVHFVLFFGFTVKQLLMPSQIIIVQNAMRVDMVALPDKVEPQVGPSPAEPTPAPTVAKPEKAAEPVKPKPTKPDKAISLYKKKPDPKQKQLEALNKLKQQDALEKLSSSKKKTDAPAAPAPPKKNLNAGNQLSQGDSVTGLERIAFDGYISQIKGTVNQNFTIPSWMADQKMKCVVEVVVDATGRVTKRALTKSSGNSTFDNAALSAVDASSPFPPVPERLTRGWGSFTIQFAFPDT